MSDAETSHAAGVGARKVQGFALKAKAAPKLHRKPSEVAKPADAPKDEILAIDAKGIESKVKKAKEAPKIIPSLANDWKLHGVRKDSAAPAGAVPGSLDEQAVAALVNDAKRREGEGEDEDKNKAVMVIEGGGMSTEQLESDSQLGAAAGVAAKGKQAAATEKNEEQKYREDVAWRPKEADVHAASWDAMPVEAFGSALLRGMGWQPGKGIGLNAKGPAAAVEYIPRHQRLGLGATPKDAEPKKGKWIPKQGESRDPKPDMVYRNEDGVQKHRKLIDEKLELRDQKIEPGADVKIVGGRHAGMRGVVRSMEAMTGNVCIELHNGEEVTSKLVDLALLRDGTDESNSRGNSGKHKREKEHRHKKHKKEHKHKKHKSETGSSKDLWVAAGLRVRIVDQGLGGGRHYNKKGVVQDVHGRKDILLQLDGSAELVDGCSQSNLETIVPKPSAGDGRALVMVVRGQSKGRYADVLERSSGENRVVVQLKHDDSVAELTMDDVCEYVGGLEDEEND